MSIPARLVPVTVYHIRRPAKSRTGIQIRCKKLGVVAIAARGVFGKREWMAAEAWVKCVGIERRALLIELNAPEVVVKYQTNIQAIAHDISADHAGLGDGEGYIYTNRVESWFIEIPLDEVDFSRSGLGLGEGRQLDWAERPTMNGPLRSIWCPHQN